MAFKISQMYSGNYNLYMALPALLFAVFLFTAFVSPGVTTGIDLQGGTLIIVRGSTEMSPELAEKALSEKFNLADLTATSISSPTGYGLTIRYAYNPVLKSAAEGVADAELLLASSPDSAKQKAIDVLSTLSRYAEVPDSSALTPEQAVDAAKTALINSEESFGVELEKTLRELFALSGEARFQKREIGSTLGETFWSNSVFVALVAMLLVAISVFLFFREIIPSLAIILAATFDVLCALAGMALFSIPLSLATIAALLMLVGYSIDTDIMLTARLLKRKEHTARERAADAMKTGLTMTGTTITAVSVMLLTSYFTQMVVVFEIAATLLLGLIGDIISTWLMNAPILLAYIERKKGAAK